MKLRAYILALIMATVACGGSTTTTSTSNSGSGNDSEESGSGGSDSDTSSSSSVFPSGLAVASPTATRDVSNASLSSIRAVTVEADSSFEEKAAVYEDILAAASDEDCQIELPALVQSVEPSCYGPALDYQGHPNFQEGQQGPNSQEDGQFPTGDLGLWTASENGEACTAAKINSLIAESAAYSDYAMILSASMVCLIERNSLEIPTEDEESLDLTELLNTAISENNDTATVTSATITNLADITDTDDEVRDAYQYSIQITETEEDDDEITITAYLKHMPTNDDNSTYKGKLWIEIEGAGQAGDKDAVAVKYERDSETSVKYELMGANYQLVDEETVIFDDNGNIAVDGDWSGNMSKAIINLDPATGLGDFSYSWQAGNGDDRARIFNGFTDQTGGCGFFGYGLRFDRVAGTSSDNGIDGFICNWAGPGNDHSMATSENLAQKQCMSLNEVSGLLEVDEERNNLSYAPVVDCEAAEGDISIKLTSEEEYSDAAISNDLIDLTTDEDFADYTDPSAPDLPEGL